MQELLPSYGYPDTQIDKPEGTYSIIYGNHETPQDPNAIPAGIDGLVLESGSTTDWAGLIEGYNEQPEFLTFYRERNPQYSSLFPHLEQTRIPLYFLDMSYKTYGSIHGMLQLPIVFLEALGGIYLFTDGMSEKPISRRSFFKKAGQVVAGAWLFEPFVTEVANNVEWWIRGSDNTTLPLAYLTETIHPEYEYGPSFPGLRDFNLYMKTLREVIIAHKLEWLMQRLSNKPHIATIIGSVHQGLKDQVQSPASDRLSFLQRYQPQLQLAAVPESVYKIARFDYNGNHWQLTNTSELPELKTLVTS